MIEVEKKFKLSSELENKFKKSLVAVSKKQITDTYYDDKSYHLTKNDMWLRKRDDRFELKVSVDRNLDRKADQYAEIVDIEKIRKCIGLKKQFSLEKDLENAGYSSFCKLKTIREKYKSSNFSIDIDKVIGNGFLFAIAEIELVVDKESEISDAIKKIMVYAHKNGLKDVGYTRGKVAQYIYEKRPDHFQVLMENKVIK